ncbi:hypothetical protein [Natronosalvus halobius]|uniref:hypothetical protein n=1 Tax=Natronosalvus halobius TaxID=2953746 RepID=UPI0020A0CFC3|nr:hypothetical protein [Natronosalvus halobius]USZ70801.1 hypothetical protein NGM15_11905 [Natronosalvus halobius]
MQTVEVTDEQYAVIQRLRAAISEDVVGRYGFVRERDAIQFLIDNLEAGEDGEGGLDVDFEADTSGRTATDDVAAAVETAIESGSQANGVAEVSYDEELETSAADEDDGAVDADGDAGADSAESESDVDADADTEDSSEDDAGGDDTSDDADASENDGEGANEDDSESADEGEDETEDTTENEDEADGDADDKNEDEGTDSGGAADDDDMLNKMMNLLDTHEDKWDESPAADYRYRVTLPDDSTEDVQTKDDVRALLFKNY